MKDRSGVFRSHCALCDCAEYERKEDSHQCGDCPHGPTEHEAVRGCSKCNCLRFVEEGLSQECFACLHRRDAHSEADEKCRPTQPHGQGGQSRSCTVRQAVEAARQLSSTEDRRVDVIMRATGRPSPTSAISSRRGSLGVGSTSRSASSIPGTCLRENSAGARASAVVHPVPELQKGRGLQQQRFTSRKRSFSYPRTRRAFHERENGLMSAWTKVGSIIWPFQRPTA